MALARAIRQRPHGRFHPSWWAHARRTSEEARAERQDMPLVAGAEAGQEPIAEHDRTGAEIDTEARVERGAIGEIGRRVDAQRAARDGRIAARLGAAKRGPGRLAHPPLER